LAVFADVVKKVVVLNSGARVAGFAAPVIPQQIAASLTLFAVVSVSVAPSVPSAHR
jgi:hypothetical protein